MRLSLRWMSLSVLVLLACPGVGRAAPAAPARASAPRPPAATATGADAAARKAVQAVVQRYRELSSYRLEGQASTEVGSSQGVNLSATLVRFVVRRPGHIASEVRNSQTTTRIVADGESLWTAVPELSQYQVQSVAAVRASPESALIVRQFDPAGDYVNVLEGVSDVRALGKDTVRTARGVVTCDRYALTVVNPEAAAQGVTLRPRILWVDPATRMVLLDSLRIEQNHPQLGLVYSVNMTRMVVVEPDPVLAADAFRFRPEPGMRRVRHFMQASPEHTAMEGRPAGDFTLETLADSRPVKLSALKGKVVLLDFWATWCGPCRGWLPIVAKARHEFESKGLVVYAVNEREPEAKVREYLSKQHLDVPVLMDVSGTVGSMYRASSIPLTVVVGRDGKVFRVMLGLHGEDDLRDVLHEVGID
jgi:thiol-disulfide isomerase/thioredoxin/outer membrane lipoprotein-sorting protein